MYMVSIMIGCSTLLVASKKSNLSLPYAGYHEYRTSHNCKPHLGAELGNQVPLHPYKPLP